MTGEDDDIVRAFVRRMVAEGMPRDRAILLELELRNEFGGRRLYVPRWGKVARLTAALAAGVEMRSAIEASGLRRAAVFQALRRRWVVDF